MRSCHICNERDHQAATCMNGNVNWRERWARTPGLLEKIFNPRPIIWLSEERAKKEVNTEKLAEEVKKFIEEQSGKEESEIPSLDKIKEVAEKSKVMGDAEIAAQAKECEEQAAKRAKLIEESSQAKLKERHANWIRVAGLPMEYPKFEPGKSLPTNINIAITAMPVGEHRPATQQPAPAPARTAPAKAEEEPLPEGWASAKAPDGRTYYYHKTTKKTQWTRPTDITPIK